MAKKRERQEEFLELYPKKDYSIAATCRAMVPPIDRSTYYHWMSEQWFRERIGWLNQEQDDYVKRKLYQQIKKSKPNLTAIIYWLNARGRDLGFDAETGMIRREMKKRRKGAAKRTGGTDAG